MIEEVLSTIKNYNLLAKNERIIVGVSGGPDSICLLHILYSISKSIGFTIIAVHINHMLRESYSQLDEEYVDNFCKSLDIKLFIEKHDILFLSKKYKKSVEETARDVRYECFNNIVKETSSDKIAVAHNLNDQAETVIMNMIRGTGIDGLKGMEFKRDNIIRPLLNIPREKIENYLHKNNITPRIDTSNFETLYTRNKIRLELIPFINKLTSKDLTKSLTKLSTLVKDDLMIINKHMDTLYLESISKSSDGNISIHLCNYHKYLISEKRRLLKHAIRLINGSSNGFELVHIENIIKFIETTNTGNSIDLPNKLFVRKDYHRIIIGNKKLDYIKIKPFNLNLGNNIIPFNSTTIYIDLEKIHKNVEDNYKVVYNSLVQFFDYDKICMSLTFRNREDGDYFKPINSSGTKKLKKYFIDNKIPRELRDKYFLLTIGSEVLWIVGLSVTDNYKPTNKTKNILRISLNNTI